MGVRPQVYFPCKENNHERCDWSECPCPCHGFQPSAVLIYPLEPPGEVAPGITFTQDGFSMRLDPSVATMQYIAVDVTPRSARRVWHQAWQALRTLPAAWWRALGS